MLLAVRSDAVRCDVVGWGWRGVIIWFRGGEVYGGVKYSGGW